MAEFSAFLAIKHAGLAMKEVGKGGKEISGGSIICTASGKMVTLLFFVLFPSLTSFFLLVAGLRSGAGSPEYSASKAA